MLEALGTRIEKDQLLDKYRNHELYAVPVEEWSSLTKKLLKALPYSLTPSQLNAVSEIIYDLKRPVPMNRLLQVVSVIFFFYYLHATFLFLRLSLLSLPFTICHFLVYHSQSSIPVKFGFYVNWITGCIKYSF